MRSKISITMSEKTLKAVDSIVDNIYIRNRSQAIEHLIDKALGENRAAVILAGGKEEHLELSKGVYGLTANIKGETVIAHAIKKLRNNGFKTIFIVAREKILTKVFELVKDGSDYGVRIGYIEEKESKGTADSLRLLKGKIGNNFLVVYGDILFNRINIEELWNDHIKKNALATIMLTTSNRPSEKGTVKVEGSKVLAFRQKVKESDIYLVFSPIFVSEPAIFGYKGESLERDVFPALTEKGLLMGHLSSEKEKHIHSLSDLR